MVITDQYYKLTVPSGLCRYSYTFPFLDTKGIVAIDDDRVGPLYEHTFPPSLAPSLSFIGIPRKVTKIDTSCLFSSFFLAQHMTVAFMFITDHRVPFL